MGTDELLEALDRAERERRPAKVAGMRFTHLDRVLWPGRGYTKGDLVRYHVRVAAAMVPHVEGRPLMLKRYHGGIRGKLIVQQRVGAGVPGEVRTEEVPTAEGHPVRRYVGARTTLLYAAQLNAIEVHTWQSRVTALDRPDRVILDLDPSHGAGVKKVVRVAHALRRRLRELGLDALVKSTGSRGLHLHVPTDGSADYGTAAAFGRRLAEDVAAEHPGDATVTRAVDRRGRRVYVDHLQNARGKTAVAAYSVRARDRAPVAVPLRWSEVADGFRPDGLSIEDVPRRLERMGDPWRSERVAGADLARAVERLNG